MKNRPLAIDLYCGLGGWTEGLLLEGYDVIGFRRLEADGVKAPGQGWNNFKNKGEVSPDWKFQGTKTVGHLNIRDGHSHTRHLTNPSEHTGWIGGKFGANKSGSKSPARKAASAMIAKIPLTLSRYIAAHYKP